MNDVADLRGRFEELEEFPVLIRGASGLRVTDGLAIVRCLEALEQRIVELERHPPVPLNSKFYPPV